MGSIKTCRWRGSRGNTRTVLCCLHGSRSRVFCAEKAWTSLDIFICWCVHLLLQDACMLHSFTLRQQLQTARQGDSILSLHVWPRMTCTLAHLSSPTPPLPFFLSPSLLRVIPCSVPTRCCLSCDCQVDQGGYSCKRRWDILVQGGVVRNSVSLGLSEGGGGKNNNLVWVPSGETTIMFWEAICHTPGEKSKTILSCFEYVRAFQVLHLIMGRARTCFIAALSTLNT